MKILLVRPEPAKQTLGLQHIMLCEPLELEYMGSTIKDIPEVDVKIIDMILEKQSFEQIISEDKPDLVGFTGYITHVRIIKDLSETAKKILPNVITVTGGVHCEVVPDDYDCNQIDYVINENALFSFPYLIKKILDNDPPHKKVLNSSNIDGFKPFKDYIKSMPIPQRSLTARYRQSYYYAFHNPPGALIKTSFGCPFTCNFCFCREITKHKYWERPLEDVICELKTISEEDIYIVDDNFLCNKKRLSKFVELLEKENIHKQYLVYGRADFIAAHPELIKRFQKVGLRTVIIGYESFKTIDLEKYNKNSSLNSYFIATRILQSLDIDIYGTFILDLSWTRADFKEFLEYLQMLKLRFVNLQPLTPIPGTDIFDKYKDKLIITREEYEKWDLAHLTLQPEHLSVREFYFRILWTYLMLSFTPANMLKNLKKYNFVTLMKITIGTRRIILQYLGKILYGK
ncbi:cobalamin-dependent protein [bacterium]|nr:cobalamin-dependent protein [bacterium]